MHNIIIGTKTSPSKAMIFVISCFDGEYLIKGSFNDYSTTQVLVLIENMKIVENIYQGQLDGRY